MVRRSEEVLPRMLVACGHAFCEDCLSRMLRCAPPGQHFRQLAPSKAVLQAVREVQQIAILVEEPPAVDDKI